MMTNLGFQPLAAGAAHTNSKRNNTISYSLSPGIYSQIRLTAKVYLFSQLINDLVSKFAVFRGLFVSNKRVQGGSSECLFEFQSFSGRLLFNSLQEN